MKIFCGCSMFAVIAVSGIANAATTARPTLANTAANQMQNRTPSTGARMPTTTNNTQSTTAVTTTTTQSETTITTPEPEPERVIIVDNKTSMFNDVLADMGANTSDSSATELANTIARQRALLDAQSEKSANDATGSSGITTANVCDAGLRKCMAEKCGSDFTKCASDSTTVWGNKMDSCRRQTKCTGHEYTMLAPEILADRDTGIELAYYQSVVNCGNRYNDCMFNICGKTLDKCLSKSAGDSAIAKCKSIADECREQDSGLVGRISGVFGDLRTAATTQAQKDEKRLYELRDLMRNQCQRFGAMFDERTLDCVYTVNFFVDKISTDNPVASKKLYSGDAFQCTPNWFGIDITTYIENAQRLTRSQKGASAAAMGAGLGTAAGLWSSGAVTRGIDTQNAEKQAKEACESVGGEWVSAGFNKGSKCDMRKPKEDCEKSGRKWDDKTGCTGGDNTGTNNNGGNNSNSTGNKPYDTLTNTLNDYNVLDEIDKKEYCKMFNQNNCPSEYCTFKNNTCTAKTDSSTGGGSNQGISPTTPGTQENQPKEEDKSVDCSKYNKANCQILHAKKCWWNGSDCVDISKKPETVNIALPITDRTGKVALLATLECQNNTYHKKSSQSETVTLKNVPSDAICSISAGYCTAKTDLGAIDLSSQKSYALDCQSIDECTNNGGTWQRNNKDNSGTCIQNKCDCPGCKKSLTINNQKYTCGQNAKESTFASSNVTMYVCHSGCWKGLDTDNYLNNIKKCTNGQLRRLQYRGVGGPGLNTVFQYNATIVDDVGGAYDVTTICIEP